MQDEETRTEDETRTETYVEEAVTLSRDEETNDTPQYDEDDPRQAIYKRHSEKMAEENAEAEPFVEPEPEPLDPESNATAGLENEETTDILTNEDPEPASTQQDEETVQVKILGDVRMVPKSKVEAAGGLKAYQSLVAGQEQLRRAADERRANEERAAALDNGNVD